VAGFYRVARTAEWRSLQDVRQQYPTADLVGRALVINVLGNRFRLVLCANFWYKALFFKGLYTHSSYDRLSLEALCQR